MDPSDPALAAIKPDDLVLVHVEALGGPHKMGFRGWMPSGRLWLDGQGKVFGAWFVPAEDIVSIERID